MSVHQFQHRRLVRASDLTDRHMGREIRVIDVEGRLVGLDPRNQYVVVVLQVGSSRAVFHLDPSASVEIGRKP